MSKASLAKAVSNAATLLGAGCLVTSVAGYHLVYSELEKLDEQGDLTVTTPIPGATEGGEPQMGRWKIETNIDTTPIVVALVLAYSGLATILLRGGLKYSGGNLWHITYSSLAAAALVGGSLAYFAPIYADMIATFTAREVEASIIQREVLLPTESPARAWPGYVGVGSLTLLAMVAGMDASAAIRAPKARGRA